MRAFDPIQFTITVGAEATNVVNVAVQVKDLAGNDVKQRRSFFAYLSDDANGDSLIATAHSGGLAVGTDGLSIALVANKAFKFTTEADGDLDVNLTETGAKTAYLICVDPATGKLTASGAITHAS